MRYFVVSIALLGCFRGPTEPIRTAGGACLVFANNHAMPTPELERLVRAAGSSSDAKAVEANTWAAYLDHGFLDYRADPPWIDADGCVHVRILEEGPRYRLGHLSVPSPDLRALFPIRDGDWFDRSAIVKGRDILGRGDGSGPIFVDVQIETNRKTGVADVTIAVPVR